MSKSLTLPAFEVRQKGSRLLVTKMRAGDLNDFTRVDPFDGSKSFSDPDQGYQRPAERPRIRKFANWLKKEAEDGAQVRMPTAVLLSARDGDVTLSAQGTITLKSSHPLPLVDGQHRQRGFDYAIREKGLSEFQDFEIPVVIMQNLDKLGEMKQFRIVNGEQKSVRTDLVNMILTQMAEQEGADSVKDADHWKVVATKVVRKLTNDKDGPWYDRIMMPDQRAYSREEVSADPSFAHKRIARATSFITSLKQIHDFLETIAAGAKTLDMKSLELFRVVNNYWLAVQSLNPRPFDEAADYVMLKTPGIFSLHRLCVSLMKDMYKAHRDFSEREFVIMLERIPELSDPAFWFVGTDEGDRGDAAKYGSMKGFTELGDLLYESSHG